MSGIPNIGAIPEHILGNGGPLDPFPLHIAADNFTAPNGSAASDHNPDKTYLGNGWQSRGAVNFELSSGELINNGTETGEEVTIELGQQNHYLQIAHTVGLTGSLSPVVRYVDTDHYYLAQLDIVGNAVQIYRNNAAFTQLTSVAVTFANADVWRFEATDSNDFLLFQNDTLVASASDTTGVSTAATIVGFRNTRGDTNSFVDVFRAGLSSGV